MPAMPTTETTRSRRCSTTAFSNSRSARTSGSRPTNGPRCPERAVPARGATASARQARTGAALPLSVLSPAGSNASASPTTWRVASSTSTVPGSAAPWRREAVLTRSPVTIPCPSASSVTAASPVVTAPRAWSWPDSREANCVPTPATTSIAARTARSASSSWAMGVPHTAITASPMNFSSDPPKWATVARASSKYRHWSSRTSSGSSDSERVVKPTRSRKRTETSRRSARGRWRRFGGPALGPRPSSLMWWPPTPPP